MIVYISIGNSDDKLTQREWSRFVQDVNIHLEYVDAKVHGRWLSEPSAQWQNACWCVELLTTLGFAGTSEAEAVTILRERLKGAATAYGQDSIAWAEAPTTEFLGAVNA